MADAFIKSDVEVSVLVPQQWSKNYYDKLLAELPFASLISKDYEGEISALGDTVKINTIPEFSDADVLAEGAKQDASAVTATTQSLVINQNVVKDFIVTNKALLQSVPFVEKLKELAIYAINKKIQALILSLTVPNAALPDHSIAYTAGTTLALVDMLAAKKLLDAQNVPMADRHMVLGSSQLNDIFNITQFNSTDYITSGSPMTSGQLPAQMLGFMPHWTTLVGNTSYFFHKSFMTMANQKGMEVREYDMGVDGYRATRVNTGTLLGIKQLDGLRVVTIS